jgi:membrane fusion protein (multidrug efflux system)
MSRAMSRAQVVRTALALALLASPLACGPGGSTAPRTRPPPLVKVSKVIARDVKVEVRAPVDLRPLTQADIGSKTAGFLDAVLVDRGDVVKKGQLLALVRPSDLPDQLAAARGVLAQASASSALAKANLDRAKTLAPSGLMSQADLQTVTSSVASAEANEAAAKANLGAIGVRLGETRITAPMDGVIWQRKLDPGVVVGVFGATAIVSMVQVDTLRVFISVNEKDAIKVTLGKAAYIELDAVPGRFEGKVVRLAPAFDPSTRSLDAEVQLENKDGALRPGMYGRGAIVLEVHPHVPVLPVTGLQISDKNKYVFVLAGDKVARRGITTGVDGGDWLEVTSGLAEGDEVVVAGADGLADGSTVRVSRSDGVASAASVSSTAPKAP